MAANTNNNVWQTNKPVEPVEEMNFAAIIKDQKKEKKLNQKLKEERDLEKTIVNSLEDDAATTTHNEEENEWDFLNSEEDLNFILPPEVLASLKTKEGMAAANSKEECDSDSVIAQMIQALFDKQYNEDLKRIEKTQNKQSKITVCLDKYMKPYLKDAGEEYEVVLEESKLHCEKYDDNFETNERQLEAIPKCSYGIDKSGEIITKHDDCGVRYSCPMMPFRVKFAAGDGSCFDMKLSNRVRHNKIFY